MRYAYAVVGLGVLSVVGGVVWLLLPRESETPLVTTQTYTEVPIDTVETEDLVSGQDTLSSLRNVGKTLECAFQFDDDTRAREGTGFFHEGKMRIDSFYTGSSGEQFTVNVINNGTSTYYWSNTETGEFALKMSTLETVMNFETATATNQLSQESVVWYTCKSWEVDGSVFEPPRNVTFIDSDLLHKAAGDSLSE